MATTMMTVSDISCEHCEGTIKNALVSAPGVQAVAVDIPAKRVRVTYDVSRIDTEQIKEILRNEVAEQDKPASRAVPPAGRGPVVRVPGLGRPASPRVASGR